MMLIYIRRKVEGWTIPFLCFVPFESPRTRVPGIVFLDERAQSCVGCYGAPLSYLSSFVQLFWWPKLVLLLYRVCVGWRPSGFRKNPGQRNIVLRWSKPGSSGVAHIVWVTNPASSRR